MNSRPIHAVIVTQNLRHNLNVVKNLTNHRPTWAVVKANAYGHSMDAAVSAFADSEGLALLEIEQACKVRSEGYQGRILLLEGIFCASDIEICASFAIDMVVHHVKQVKLLEDWIRVQPDDVVQGFVKRVQVWMKLNSGMNRLGFKSAEYGVIGHILKSLGITVNHLTHFANADEDSLSPSVSSQWEVFEQCTRFEDGLRSAANSAAIISHAFTHADWTRPGIMLYGASPSGRVGDIEGVGLRPGMLLRSEIIAIQEISKGETVGYGSAFTASRSMRIGVVACGYADGYPRNLPNGTPIWVAPETWNKGSIAPLAGRVSMDMLTIDLSNSPQAKVGTPVEMWGEYIPIDEVAVRAGTIGYELMCGVTSRVPYLISD